MLPATVCEIEPTCRDTSAEPGYGWTVLRRHGRRPLFVLGRVLLRADNRCAGAAWWSDVSILETSGCRYAVLLRHGAAGAQEAGWCDAWLCETPQAVRARLCAHNPTWALPSAAAAVSPVVISRFQGAWAGLLAALLGARGRVA